jgi:hypothetical protein
MKGFFYCARNTFAPILKQKIKGDFYESNICFYGFDPWSRSLRVWTNFSKRRCHNARDGPDQLDGF